MEKNFRNLMTLVNNGDIDLNLFYVAGVYQGYVSLQGNYNPNLIKRLTEKFSIVNWEVTQSGWIECTARINETTFEITLT
jgi:hypothetical protein